jgi:hypothetical protein
MTEPPALSGLASMGLFVVQHIISKQHAVVQELDLPQPRARVLELWATPPEPASRVVSRLPVSRLRRIRLAIASAPSPAQRLQLPAREPRTRAEKRRMPQ